MHIILDKTNTMRLIDTIPKKKLADMMKETTKKALIGLLLDTQMEVNMLKEEIKSLKNEA